MSDSETEHQHGYLHDKQAFVTRLRRIEGQARGLQRMVEEEQYCIDILTQVSAITSALHGFSIALLEEHLNHCVADAGAISPEAGREKVAEAVAAIHRLVRS